MNQENERHDGLQVLRGMAALMVMLSHSMHVVASRSPEENTAMMEYVKPGAAGVDLFFVISGFVITLGLIRKQPAWGTFLFDRASRILPLYLLLSIPFFFMEDMSLQRTWNTFLFIPILDISRYSSPANDMGWSIGFEVWFYTLMTACLFVFRSRARPSIALFYVSLLALVGLNFTGYEFPFFMRFIGSPLAIEFLLGVGICLVHKSIPAVVGFAIFAIGAGALWVNSHDFVFLFDHHKVISDADTAWLRVVLWGLPSAAIVAGIAAFGKRLQWPMWARRFGDLSYSFYLTQLFAEAVVRYFQLDNLPLAASALFCINLAIAMTTHKLIEVPCASWLKNTKHRRLGVL